MGKETIVTEGRLHASTRAGTGDPTTGSIISRGCGCLSRADRLPQPTVECGGDPRRGRCEAEGTGSRRCARTGRGVGSSSWHAHYPRRSTSYIGNSVDVGWPPPLCSSWFSCTKHGNFGDQVPCLAGQRSYRIITVGKIRFNAKDVQPIRRMGEPMMTCRGVSGETRGGPGSAVLKQTRSESRACRLRPEREAPTDALGQNYPSVLLVWEGGCFGRATCP